jgi:hypothetical protein
LNLLDGGGQRTKRKKRYQEVWTLSQVSDVLDESKNYGLLFHSNSETHINLKGSINVCCYPQPGNTLSFTYYILSFFVQLP